MTRVRLEQVTKTYVGESAVVRDVDLTVGEGERLVLFGPSGSGKTTLLRLIAGLEKPTTGSVFLNGCNVTDQPPHRRDIAMMFQQPLLYPHLSVRDNLLFSVRMRGLVSGELEERLQTTATWLRIQHLLGRQAHELSGGEQQRVALGRVFVDRVGLYLLDEPLSHLEASWRWQLRLDLQRLQTELGTTMIHVTHDPDEAMTLGQRIAVIRSGRLQQVDTPHEIYTRPANLFVAESLSPLPINQIPCEAQGGEIDWQGNIVRIVSPCPDQPVTLGIRPEHLRIAPPDLATVRGQVRSIQELGQQRLTLVSVEGQPLLVCEPRSQVGQNRPPSDSEVGLMANVDGLLVFDQSESQSRIATISADGR